VRGERHFPAPFPSTFDDAIAAGQSIVSIPLKLDGSINAIFDVRDDGLMSAGVARAA